MTAGSTVDPTDQARFNQLAALWWDPNGPMWPLHGLNRFRVQVLQQRLALAYPEHEPAQPLSGLKVLDVGCGGGLLSEALARMGAQVTGVDTAANNIRIAREHAQREGLDIRYLEDEVSALLADPLRYDIVMNLEVVEHVVDLPSFLQDCAMLVRPGGRMFVATINRTLIAWFTAILGAEYLLRLLPKGTHRWRQFVRPDELTCVLKRNQLQPVWQTGVAFNPWTRRFRLTDRLSVNYLLEFHHCQRPPHQPGPPT